jgi:putative phosphoesterase
MRIGVISDTHGLLRPDVFRHFEAVEHILHAGDIGPLSLLTELEAIAPVTAVWGNTDGFDVRNALPEVAGIELAARHVIVTHGHQLGSPTPEALQLLHATADIIVYGHTHRPMKREVGDCLVLNPGGAGAPRFGLRPSLMLLHIENDGLRTELLQL